MSPFTSALFTFCKVGAINVLPGSIQLPEDFRTDYNFLSVCKIYGCGELDKCFQECSVHDSLQAEIIYVDCSF